MVQFKDVFLAGKRERISARHLSTVFVRAASTTISRTSATRRVTIPPSRCRQLLLRRLLQARRDPACLGPADRVYKLPPERLWTTCTTRTPRPTIPDEIGVPKERAASASATSRRPKYRATTSGRWPTRPLRSLQRNLYDHGPGIGAACPARAKPRAIATSRSGIPFSCSSLRDDKGAMTPLPNPRDTGMGLSESQPFSKACT
jgi:hypothetical protein